ncbi:MAG: LysR family transcriptional regulator [Firmicutes bacterium]|nr:LysR family transcriptional regulator [Bacillota bacterium]
MIDSRLTAFITLAKYRNYTKTAEILHLTQPAVTQQIQYLERFYGVKLFVRHRTGVHLTPEGELFLAYANKVDSLARQVKRALHNQASIPRKQRIGATLTIGEYVLPAILSKHRRMYPNTDVSMSVQNTDTILERLDQAHLDLGLIEGLFNKKKYEYHLLKKDRLVLAASPKHQLAQNKEVDIEALSRETLIVREAGSGTRLFFEENLRKKGYSLRDFVPYMEIGNLNAIKSLVMDNVGVSVISAEVVKWELASGELCEIAIKGLDLEREFCFVYLPDSLARDFINEFMHFCYTYIESLEPLAGSWD